MVLVLQITQIPLLTWLENMLAITVQCCGNLLIFKLANPTNSETSTTSRKLLLVIFRNQHEFSVKHLEVNVADRLIIAIMLFLSSNSL
jgi:hypothetical protein